ncbi:transcriptional regulator [Massilia sp. BJB1822]|uniref:transcriptional regulator n=1 Tax=Massilia sp. BJB1822 TaxID=2744470 RepID=UPI001592DB8D|nr:transcriptional regulator [Massilia sp. BJB1822]
MELIEPEEMAEFRPLLTTRGLDLADFALEEVDATDPKSDEVAPLQGYLTGRRRSTGQTRQYVTGDGSAWLRLLSEDLGAGTFTA